MIDKEWCEKVNYLKDMCRCRYAYTSVEDMYDFCMTKCRLKERCGFMRTPFVYKYNVPGLGLISEHGFEKLITCIVAFTDVPERDYRHTYDIIFDKFNTFFVKDFKDGNLITTRNMIEAKHFTSDKECDDVMEYIVNNKNPFTMVVVEYKGNEISSECVHYPNKHWSINECLMPSLMNKSVKEWHKEHDKNIY